MKTKNVFGNLIGIIMLIASCTSIKPIGSVTQVSTRNIDSKNHYVLLKNYVNPNNSSLENNEGKSIEEAINNAVQSVPGGEYMMNVKFFRIGSDYYGAQGDVWGDENNQQYNGFRIGDRVVFNGAFKWRPCVIVGMIDAKSCMVKFEDNNRTTQKNFSDLQHITQEQTALNENKQQSMPPNNSVNSPAIKDTSISQNQTNLNIGDHVKWQHEGDWYTGTVNAIIENGNCLIKFDDDGKLTSVAMSDLIKTEKLSFNIGDHVTWQYKGDWYTGTVNQIIDDNTCKIKFDDDGTFTNVATKDLQKIQK